MTSNNDDIEQALQENLDLRRHLMSEVTRAVEPVTFKWRREHFGRSEDQPLFFALLLVLIAITIYVFV